MTSARLLFFATAPVKVLSQEQPMCHFQIDMSLANYSIFYNRVYRSNCCFFYGKTRLRRNGINPHFVLHERIFSNTGLPKFVP